MNAEHLTQAAQKIRSAQRVVAFTGAGISVESGIPPFRGPNGLWTKYDPTFLDIRYFQAYPAEAWKQIKEIFYDYFGQAAPNAAHIALAEMEKCGLLAGIITQNIDNLHQAAGSKTVVEYHGTSHRLTCTGCARDYEYRPALFERMPPRCGVCGAVLKPDFVFFGEGIPSAAHRQALLETRLSDVWLVIGTTGEIVPASLLPQDAKRNGAAIIEVNIAPSNYTSRITDIFLQGKATEVMKALWGRMKAEGGRMKAEG